MTYPSLAQVDQQGLQQDEGRNKVLIGMASDGTPLYVRITSDGCLFTKLMGYDVDGSEADVQVITDEQGRLRVHLDEAITFTGDITVDTSALEALIADQQLDYHISDWLESGTDVYIGYLTKAGAWLIKKISTATGQVRYVHGSSGYSFADPASLSYTLYSTEF